MWRLRRLPPTQSNLGSLRGLTWPEFEELVGEVYRRRGYHVKRTPSGADGGVDLILMRGGERVLVQCKRWRTRRVGVKPIRELHGLTDSADFPHSRAIFVTSGTYTLEARRFAEENGLELVEGRQLLLMIAEVRLERTDLGDGLDIRLHEATLAEPLPGTEPEAEPEAQVESEVELVLHPPCPLCGKPTVMRTVERGRQAGNRVWGCVDFPRCRGSVPIEREAGESWLRKFRRPLW
jgi:restriction system protein